jgi:hypothetical protein
MQSAFLKGFTDKQQKPYSMPKGTKFERGKYIMAKYEEQAKAFCDAIRDFAKSEDAINNMESYLSYHFPEWLRKYAYDMESLSAEMANFAHMYD